MSFGRFRPYFILLILALWISSSVGALWAAAPDSWTGKSITSIEFQGLKRIEKEAVLTKIQNKVGQAFVPEQVKADIQTLFAMGYFDDIDIEGDLTASGLKLLYRVKERPVIAQIEFDGNEQISDSDLKEKIKVKEWSILDLNKIQEDVEILQKFYEEKGFYLAKVKFEVKPHKSEGGKDGQEDQVDLVYHVSDYDKIQIKKITFLNNKVFSDEQLKTILGETREGSALSFITSSGNFKESTFKQDLQRLHYWYLDHGYVKFRHENPVVTVSDDKRWIYISIYVEEGDRYKMGKTDYSGDLLYSKDELNQDRQLLDDEYFSLSKRNLDIQRLTEKYQDLGYAFVNVIPKMDIKDETKIVDIEYQFEKGNLVHFGEITVVGNTKTHDKVIRRELKIKEGELYSGSKLRISRENVERLGYFAPGEIVFNTKTPPGKPDILDVEIQIKERSTGTVTLGAGFGTLQGFFLQSQISEINLFGRGQSVSLSGTYTLGGQVDNLTRLLSRSFSVNFTDPYAFDTHWIMGGDIFWTISGITNKYNTRKLGFNTRIGHPIFDYTNAYMTYKNEYMAIVASQPQVDQSEIDADTGILSSLVFNVIRDKRNNRFETTGGNFQNISFETAGLGGDKHFLKAIANNRFYYRIVGDLVFRNNIEVGTIFKIDQYPVPPSERFYLGGPLNMRGFQALTLGPIVRKANINGVPINEPLGGQSQLLGMFELEYPLIKDIGLKAVTFFDAGNVYKGTFPDLNDFTIRTNLGLGVRWFSPLGPLRFEWGFPLARRTGPNSTVQEDSSVFQFWIGPPF